MQLNERISEFKDADIKQFNQDLISYAMSDPYDSYCSIKERYPAWFSEYLVFLWDTSGLLNDEVFKHDSSNSVEIQTTIIEEVTSQYLDYLIATL